MSTQSKSDAREGDIQRIVRMTGRTFIELQSSWWGNEKLGKWVDELLVDVKKVTEDAVCVGRPVPLGEPLRFAKQLREVDTVASDVGTDMAQRYRESLRDAAWGEPRTKAQEAWFPKSKVVRMISHEGPRCFKVYPSDGGDDFLGRSDDVDIVVREKIVVRGKRRQYRKLSVDADYEVNQVIDELPWESWHSAYEFNGRDEFVCMTVDDRPEDFAERMQGQGYSVALHVDLVEE